MFRAFLVEFGSRTNSLPMPLTDFPTAPGWVTTNSAPNSGLDLTGLRLPVLTIGGQLLDGITTVTPLVRYLSLQAWIVSSYIHARLPDDREVFQEFAAKVEAAIAVGNLIQHPNRTGLVGAVAGGALARSSSESIPLKRLVKQLATTLYQNPGMQLRFLLQGSSVSGLSAERGAVLAACAKQAVANTDLGCRFSAGEFIDSATRADVRSFGIAADILGASSEELDILVSGILPLDPQTPSEQNRVSTYTTLLGLAAGLRRLPSADDFFAEAGSLKRASHRSLYTNLDSWLRHLVRDSLAVGHEHVLQEVLRRLRDRSHGIRMVNRARVIRDVCEDTSAGLACLREFHLMEASEGMATLAFSDLRARVREIVTVNEVVEAGLRRWDSPLSELSLIARMLAKPEISIVLLPVLWCMASLRAQHWPESEERPFEGRVGFGWDLIGVCAVIMPEVDRFDREALTLVEVMEELALRTVEQHLRVSWSRMASDSRHDVALLITDGDEWQSRNEKHVQEYAAGRTDSRIGQAVGWLEQLQLIDPKGLTDKGQSLYAKLCDRNLRTA